MVFTDIYCILCISTMKLFLLLFFPILAFAKGDECINEHKPDQRAFCLASEYANATACEPIQNLDLRSSCIAVVRNKQRDSRWAVKPMEVAALDTRGDRRYIWQHN